MPSYAISIYAAALAVMLPLSAHAQSGAPVSCEIASTRDIGILTNLLSERAVEIFRRARSPGWRNDASLRAWVAPNAEFDLGSGDVGNPMGKGLPGARKMSLAVNADTFRYFSWSYIPMEVDPCGKQNVKVEFVDSKESTLVSVEFEFLAGILVSAKGWSQWFVSGSFR